MLTDVQAEIICFQFSENSRQKPECSKYLGDHILLFNSAHCDFFKGQKGKKF